ncbi:MAG: hypothetical protein M1821_007170 [Bathelium mastoideum]|nr:MAG: hypothetical protein M1821_007170 [Bathelium mastoideum]
MRFHTLVTVAICTITHAQAYDQFLGFNEQPEVEQRSISEIYKAALAEGGVVTCWHGGDAPNQQDALKKAFEEQFPGMTLNLSIDFSTYQSANLDRQMAVGNLYVDSIVSQQPNDFPKWKDDGALLKYQPLGFEKVYPAYRDANAAYYGTGIIAWTPIWNTEKSNSTITGFKDFLKPEYKDKLVLTYPTEDDTVLFSFNLILQKLGYSWFEKLLQQNPRWVQGIQTPTDLMAQPNSSYVATFTSTIGFAPSGPFNISFPEDAPYTSWISYAAIFKDAPHPEAAKLLQAFLLSEQFQKSQGSWSVFSNFTVPNQPFDISDVQNTDPTAFGRFASDRARIERLRYFLEDKIGTPQGLSPLKGGIY